MSAETITQREPSEQELAKFEAQAEQARAEARKADQEARKLAAEAAVAEANAERTQIDLQIEREVEEARLNSDDHRRIFRFSAPVSSTSAASCISTLSRWDRTDPDCDIEIVFNSPGGGVIDGMALFDTITSLSKRGGGRHKVTCGSLGYAASMAGILLQAGDERWIGKESYLLIHEISATSAGKIGDMLDAVKLFETMCSRVVDIFVSRSEGKCTKARFTKGWLRTDWWLDSAAALKLGFVDSVR